jgi:putative transferase (TIGR04331 family)
MDQIRNGDVPPMKTNFVVSMNRKMWLPGAKKLFLADAYLNHLLEKNGELVNFDEVEVAEPLRPTKQDFIRDHEYVDAKLKFYTPILAARLDQIHGTNHGEWFWRKSISLSLLRHVTFCYGTFQVCERYFRLEEHTCRILSEDSYHTPRDFNEHYPFFQISDYAQEQLFSVYARLFHPGIFEEVADQYIRPAQKTAIKPAFMGRISRLTPAWLWRKILSLRSPTVGIFGAYFKSEYLEQLIIKSWGKIHPILLKSNFPTTESIDLAKRAALAAPNNECDRFDQFFFETLRYAMPKAFVEDWSDIADYYRDYFKRYKKLRYVTCENWIGNMYSAIALAVLHLQGVKHIYNEHNFLSRPFLGNSSKYLLPLVDTFATLGWFEPGIPNLLKAGSLFGWSEQKSAAKDCDILFISSLPRVRPAEISACYGDSGAKNVAQYFDFNKKFLTSLKNDTLKSLVYRGYPAAAVARLGGAYDEAYVLRNELDRVGRVDVSNTPGRILIQRARLIIVNYISTSLLQALLADIPTVFFWNRSTRYTEESYEKIFDGLIDAGICQTEPVSAATFIEKIKSSPEAWWHSAKVRQARQIFIEKFLGPPEALMDYLLECAKSH